MIYTTLLCEPGARVTNQFEVFSNGVNQGDWYLLPIKVQRMYVIFLSDTQHPIKIRSFANITSERETLKNVNYYITVWINSKFINFETSISNFRLSAHLFHILRHFETSSRHRRFSSRILIRGELLV